MPGPGRPAALKPPKGYKCKIPFTNKVVQGTVPSEQPSSQKVRAIGAVVHNLLVAVDKIMAAADMTLLGPSAQQEPGVVDLTKDAGQPSWLQCLQTHTAAAATAAA